MLWFWHTYTHETKEHKETLGGVFMFNTLIVVMIPWVFAYAQTYQIVHTKFVQFFVYQLYP